jgi:hypothetical protein
LESDYRRLQTLAEESSIFSFQVAHPPPSVGPPETYRIRFHGVGLQWVPYRYEGSVQQAHDHEVLIQLVAEYPRSAPHMRWLTPIFHPNISGSGAVCLGGWGTHWAPSLQLDRLCEMLWDMLRFANYDTRSPFNQQAATWLRGQRQFRFPIDRRELRDRPLIVARPATVTDVPADDLMRFDSPVNHLAQTHPDHNGANDPSTDSHSNQSHSSQSQSADSDSAQGPRAPQPDILFLD